MPQEANDRTKAIKQFSRFAHHYDTYNVIQTEVARELVERISPNDKYHTIIDMGSGSGQVYKNLKKNHIVFDQFIALDSSEEMLSCHPNDPSILKIQADFNKDATYEYFTMPKEHNLLLSSSALQWSEDLEFVFSHLSQIATKAKFAIFTSKTFKTLHQTANIHSPIYTPENLREAIGKYYDANFELKEYRLTFENVRDMFNYIKKSGVSGGEKQLSYKQVKSLMNQYPLDYLEFEVLFVEATSLA